MGHLHGRRTRKWDQLTSPPTINIMDENPVADRAVGFLVQCIYMHVTERSTVVQNIL